MATIERKRIKKWGKCRLCGDDILKCSEAVVLTDVHV
jgi:hypothetical protein